MAAAVPAHAARPLLTSVGAAPRLDLINVLTDDEQTQLSRDAVACFELMKTHSDASGAPILGAHAKFEPIWVAAALALLTGRFRKKNGKPNPSAAAAAFGKALSRPSAVTEWVAKLEVLDRALHVRERAQLKRKRDEQSRLQAVEQSKEAIARELTAVVRKLLREYDPNARLDEAGKVQRNAEIASSRSWLQAATFCRVWQTPGKEVLELLPPVSSLELCTTPEFENLSALLPELPSRQLVGLLYDVNSSRAHGFKDLQPSQTWLAFVRGRLSSSQLRQLRDGPFDAQDRLHALLCRVRDGGEVGSSDVDASIATQSLQLSRESMSASTDDVHGHNDERDEDDDSCHVWEF